MKQTGIVVAPGRGTYNATELGYLTRYHGSHSETLDAFDAYRAERSQETIRALDGAEKFSPSVHTRGDNASPLIYASSYFDFLSIDRDRFDIVGVTGNSMGWYIALACAGALDAMGGLDVVNTMGTLMQEKLIGGQLVYPCTDADWREVPGKRAEIDAKIEEINARADHDLALSIDLGGFIVLAGNSKGLSAFEREMPRIADRFPMRLKNHAAFHTSLQEPVAEEGRVRLGLELFRQPEVPLIDGRGGIWYPKASNVAALRDYTLDHQVVQPYDFAQAIRTAAREFMPDVFIVLGPGSTLGGSVAQSLVRAQWRGCHDKASFRRTSEETRRLIGMGESADRDLVI